jgi:cytochrome c oxidase subunit II
LRSGRTRRIRFIGAAVVALLAMTLSACSNAPQSALDPQGPYAQQPDDLFRVVFWIAVAVFILVQGLIIYAVVKFRRKPNDTDLPVQVHGNTKLEIFWTLIPALILAGIAVPTVRSVFELSAEPDDALIVEVIGHRWWWEFHYPEQGITTANELVIPAGQPVRLEMTAEEAGGPGGGAVIHSFWVPQLAGKRDVVPGRINTLNMQADEPGRYQGACAEYCGLSHANMRHYAVALAPEDFDTWISDQQQDAPTPEPGSLEERGFELVAGEGASCIACHAIQGTNAQGNVGPDLTHLMSREWFAGAIFEMTDENLTSWVKNAPEMKPMQPQAGWGMPNLGLSDEEVEAIVAYLKTLE